MSVQMLNNNNPNRKVKVVVILGATGTGKSRLSLDLAIRLGSSEIINSDKIQVYKGLDITTNQLPLPNRLGVPHHLLGDFDQPSLPSDEFSSSDFRSTAEKLITDIVSRGNIPILAGGSNSFVHALLVENFDPESDPFNGSGSGAIGSELKYDCCFLWVDVALPVLYDYLEKRVDEMIETGMEKELADFYDRKNDSGESESDGIGLWKSIGVPEFARYFREYPPGGLNGESDPVRREAYERAVREVKENTWLLAERQVGKIVRLRESEWEIKKVDATASIKEALKEGGGKWREVWEKQVLEPSINIVNQFLES